MQKRRVLICGGRDYNDAHSMYEVIMELPAKLGVLLDEITIVHGAAKGADTLAEKIAMHLNIKTEKHPAKWHIYGKKAGPIRNQEMLDSGIDFVVAFPGGRGTEDTIHRTTNMNIPIWIVNLPE